MSRNINRKIVRALRREVGFSCPVDDCGNPFLEFHHFDPPWRVGKIHRQEGMIALCQTHHDQADAGAFTNQQLRDLKKNGRRKQKLVSGKFNWMRNQLLAIISGGQHLDPKVILRIKDKDVIWFERDRNGAFLLNFDCLTTSGEERAYMRGNQWYTSGNETDIDCPPSGKRVKIKYANDDFLEINFVVLESAENFELRYKENFEWGEFAKFPLTAVELEFNVSGSELNMRKGQMNLGSNTLKISTYETDCVVHLD